VNLFKGKYQAEGWEYEMEIKRHEHTLDRICMGLSEIFIQKWKKARKASLEITFGMGSEYVSVNEKQVFNEDEPLVLEFLENIWEVTNGYRSCCPNDISIERRK